VPDLLRWKGTNKRRCDLSKREGTDEEDLTTPRTLGKKSPKKVKGFSRGREKSEKRQSSRDLGSTHRRVKVFGIAL